MMGSKRYLGDSVYAELDTFHALVLSTDNGTGATNTIVLEPEVWRALLDFVERNPVGQRV